MEGDSALPDGFGAAKLDLLAHCLRHEDRGEVEQQVQAGDFVEMDQRARIADDFRCGSVTSPEAPLDILANELSYQRFAVRLRGGLAGRWLPWEASG